MKKEDYYNGIIINVREYLLMRNLLSVVREAHHLIESKYKTPEMCSCLKLTSKCKEYLTLQIIDSVIDTDEPLRKITYDDIKYEQRAEKNLASKLQ